MIDDQYKMGLMAAEGYLELGMTDDAMREFMNLPREAKFSIEGLTLLMEIHRAEEEWPEMESVAERLWAADPGNVVRWIDWAQALRLANSINSARILLLEALERFPEEGLVHYHLACCECQLGNLPSAREHLMESKKRCRICRVLALTDEGELQPIWTDYAAPQFQS